MSTVSLKTSDGKTFEIDLQIANQSKVIRDMLQNTVDDKDPSKTPPQINVDSTTFEKVIEWAEHHKNDPEPKTTQKAKEIGPWDNEFLQVDQELLFEIIKAANYLNIPKLLDTACLFVANMLKGKNPEEIRRMFNIRNDLGDVELLEDDFCEGCRVSRRRKGRGRKSRHRV